MTSGSHRPGVAHPFAVELAAGEVFTRAGRHVVAPSPLADIKNPYGMSWTGDRIVYAQEAPRIFAVLANGGAPTRLITLDETKQELAQSPQPRGGAVLFTLRTGTGSWNDADIELVRRAQGEGAALVSHIRLTISPPLEDS